MEIEEAIRVHEVLMEAPVLKDDPRVVKALQLGIEALKRIDDQRNGKILPYDRWLPGETED